MTSSMDLDGGRDDRPSVRKTCLNAGNRSAISSTFGSVLESVTTSFAPASLSRISSASGPNNVDIGIAMAPSL